MASVPVPCMILFTALLAATTGLPADNRPSDWSAEDYLQYMMWEQQQRSLWPSENTDFDTDNQGIGMISGIDVNSSGIVHIFHRADREWDANTFKDNDELTDELKEPIDKSTILTLDPTSGKVLSGFGEGLFNLPHGLKIDHENNIWVTDVGRHQVFRISGESNSPDLTLGEAFVPGSDIHHFCKPTDVAIAKNGHFFVADGYCNRRILKFDKDGNYLMKIGSSNSEHKQSLGPDPYSFNTPHSLTLVEDLDLICVADRDNKRAMCFNAGLTSEKAEGAFNRTLVPQDEIGQVYSIYFNAADKTVITAGEVADVPLITSDSVYYPARAYTFGLDGREQGHWAHITEEIARRGPSLIHALCTSGDGNDYFLADILQNKVYKYSKTEVPWTAE